MNAIVIIPARGGSKRIPGKNIRMLDGKPLLAHVVSATAGAGLPCLVSTDSPDIAAVAREYGAEVPFMRPAELSDDHTGTQPVLRHAVQWLEEQGRSPEFVCCLYATAALVRSEDLAYGLQALRSAVADMACSVSEYPLPPQWALRLEADGRLALREPEYAHVRSQDLEPLYCDAGQFYWFRTAALLSPDSDFAQGKGGVPVVLPRNRVVDLDTEADWEQLCRLWAIHGRKTGGK